MVLGLLLVVWSSLNVVLNAIPLIFPEIPGADLFWKVIARIIPVFVAFPMYVAVYRWTAHPGRQWRGTLWGAGLAAVGLQALILGFGWYLASGLANYELVYGSVATIIALLLFAYLASWITLFGAYVAAAVDHRPPPAQAAQAPTSDR
jgi:membrane protein